MCEFPRLEGELDVAVAVRADQIVRGSIGARRRGPPMDPCWAASALAVREAAGENRRIEDRTPDPSGHRPKRRNRRERQLERDRGAGQVSPRSDLYALGAVVWHIATGRTPTVDPLSGRIVPPQGLDPTLSAFIVAVTANAPADRPRSAAEAREILARPAPVQSSIFRDEKLSGQDDAPTAPPQPARPRPWHLLPPAPRPVTREWQDLVESLAEEDARKIEPFSFGLAGVWSMVVCIVVPLLGLTMKADMVNVLVTLGLFLLAGAFVLVSSRNEAIRIRASEYMKSPATGHRTRTFVEGDTTLCPVVEWTAWRPVGVDANYRGFGKIVFNVPDLTGAHQFQSAQVTTEFGEACKARGTVPVLMRPGALDAIIVMEP